MDRGRRKAMVGVVVSNKMDKTAVVAVERRVRHPLYRKIIRRTTRYKAHDANNGAQLGDVVRIVETRPMSKDKRWRIAATLVQGNVAEVAPREIGVPEEALARPEPPPAPAPVAAEEPTAEAPVAEAPVAEAPATAPEAAVAEEAPAEESVEERAVATEAVEAEETAETPAPRARRSRAAPAPAAEEAAEAEAEPAAEAAEEPEATGEQANE